MKYLIIGVLIGFFVYFLAYRIAEKFNFNKLSKKLKEQYEDYENKLVNQYNLLGKNLEIEYKAEEDRLITRIDLLREEEYQVNESIKLKQNQLGAEDNKFLKQQEEWDNKINAAKIVLDEINGRIDSALETEKKIAELKRQEEADRANIDYFKLNVPQVALNDIKILRSVENFISNKSELNKIIWKLGYEKPFKELCGKILKAGEKNVGIYKITNQDNGKVYIGQSTDLKIRISDHIKSGIGIDSKNLPLYNDMRGGDLTNFTFEIVEFCSREELNEKEKFWINYYSSNVYGYNGTQGNK